MSNRVSTIISDLTLSKIIQIESAGRPTAKAPTSSATGLGQFLSTTWLGTVRKHRPDWFNGRTQAQVLAMRRDPEASIEMLARFTEDNAAALGRGYTDGDLYLAHFSGVVVARKLLRAPASDPASKYFSQAAIVANRSILQGKTVGQVRAWAANKMAAAGRTNWITKFWTGDEPAALATTAPSSARGVKVDEGDEVDASNFRDEDVDEAQPPDGESDLDIEVVQRRLAAMGYTPGGLDGGKDGMSMTVGAVASFKNDRHLQGAPVIDDALKAAIKQAEAEGFKRPISAVRANATEADLAPKVEAVRETWRSRLAAKIGTIGLAISSFFGWVVDQFETLQTNPVIAKIVSIAGSVPWYVWGGAIMSALIFIWQSQNKIGASTTTAFNEGRLTAGEQPAAEAK